MKFATYEHKLTYRKQIIMKYLIVLKEDDLILKWTNYHQYIKSNKNKTVVSLTSDNKKRTLAVVGLLNYLFFDKYHIKKLTDMKVDMIKDYMKNYGLCKLPGDNESTHRSKTTVETTINYIIDFLDEYIRQEKPANLKSSDIYKKVDVFSKKRKKYIQKKVPVFEIFYDSSYSKEPIYRNIPEKVFQIIMNEIYEHHRNILMIAASCAFAGLRPSEACNLRREDSELGPGIYIDMKNDEIANIRLELKQELVLRSDLVSVGKIKRERVQKVYPAFINIWYEFYQEYLRYIEGKPYETAFGPLTTNRTGIAMTYDAYCQEFKNVIKDCIPIMLASDDPEVAFYGSEIEEKGLSPHIFRHWFSVKLTIYGEDAAGLMHWRGDSSPESALTYIANKSDLEKQYKMIAGEVFNYNMWRANKLHERH